MLLGDIYDIYDIYLKVCKLETLTPIFVNYTLTTQIKNVFTNNT